MSSGDFQTNLQPAVLPQEQTHALQVAPEPVQGGWANYQEELADGLAQWRAGDQSPDVFKQIIASYLMCRGSGAQADFARAHGVSPATVSRWAHGHSHPMKGMSRVVVRWIQRRCRSL